MGHSVLARYTGGIQGLDSAATTLLSHRFLLPGLCNGLLTLPPSSFLAHFQFILLKVPSDSLRMNEVVLLSDLKLSEASHCTCL